jgi:hypothetical protein
MKTRLLTIKEKRENIVLFGLGKTILLLNFFYLKKHRRIHILHQISQE